ncbi:uncharacterized protein LOC126839538 [Adelges cooleyi]|uniref:uncharacterized protein LOC126839538 n=1 Tax=Adelges cooleyi TaxID=133065 RepID=UPI00217F2D5C|nr:uncharacterized protein LOC126839538 [Adelges cooleyi]
MVDGFNAIVLYMLQDEDVAYQFHSFIYDYLYRFWFVEIGLDNISVFRRDIRTNNYLESYHSMLLQIMKPHPKVWEFIDQLRFLENQSEVEFKQARSNLRIRVGVSTRTRESNTRAIEEFLEEMTQDYTEGRIQTFLRRAGHRVDGYITQKIGPYPGEPDMLLQEVVE